MFTPRFNSTGRRSLWRAATGLLALCVLALGGCKAKPAEDSGFLTAPHLMTANQNSPFHRMYWNRQHDPARYTEILVAPVNTNYVRAQNLWESASLTNVSHDQIVRDLEAFAAYTQQSFIKAASEDPRHRFKVVDKAGPRTVILEVAIVQIVPSKAVLNALGFVSWVPAAVSTAGSVATSSEDSGKGVVAIEARLRDGQTGEVVGMFADRERPKTALLDLKALNWWAPARDLSDEWAAQLIELANTPPGTAVKDSPAFELLVW